MKILTNDPSITGWGWAVVQLVGEKARILDTGCIRTSPDHKKKRIRKSDDYARRLAEISQELFDLHQKYNLDWVLAEAPHGSQHASGAKMQGAVTGIISAYTTCLDLPVEWYSEGDCKKHLCGKRSLTKRKTIELIIDIYGKDWYRDIKYKDQAVADALAVFHVGRSSSQALIYAANQ